MRKWLLLALLALLWPVPSQAQSNIGGSGNTSMIRFAGAPSGACQFYAEAINNATTDFYVCNASNAWVKVGSAGGGGTITGGGTAGQVTVWSGATAITGDANLLYSTTNHNLSVLHTATITCTGILAVCGDGDGTQGTLLELGQDDQNSYGFVMRNNSAAASVFNAYIDNTGLLNLTNVTAGMLIKSGAGDITVSPNNGSGNVIANHFDSLIDVKAGVDNSAAGSVIVANGAANAHTIFASGATTTNTIKGFTAVPTNGHLVTCTVATTVCTLTDGGAVPTGTVTSIATTSPITGGTITGTGTIACATCTVTVASGAKALATGAIGSGACTAAQTDTATGTLTTDAFEADFNADPTGVTGYAPTVNGMLTIIKYPTADTVNFKVCNNTLSSITPGAITLNWRVVR